MAIYCHNTTGMPVESLLNIHDCLALALDASERSLGYTQAEREARSYMRTAMRQTKRLMEGRA